MIPVNQKLQNGSSKIIDLSDSKRVLLKIVVCNEILKLLKSNLIWIKKYFLQNNENKSFHFDSLITAYIIYKTTLAKNTIHAYVLKIEELHSQILQILIGIL